MYSTFFLSATFIALEGIGKLRLWNGHLRMWHLEQGFEEQHAELDGDWEY